MTRTRHVGAAGFGFAACVVLFVLAAVSCASPTQIVVEVFTDACPGSGRSEVVASTGIAVGTAENIESQRPASTHVGCESATGVGTLTIYPSGANDEEVALKVLGGVEVAPDRCDPPGYAGCIVSQRTVRFVPHQTERVTVVLSLACLNRECPGGKTCDNGACIDPEQILADGGTTDDAELVEAATLDGPASDAPVVTTDAADPKCAGCAGACDGTKCIVDCTAAKSCNGQVCASSLPCEVTCRDKNSCDAIACSATSCKVTCSAGGACVGGITTVSAMSSDIECNTDNACNNVGIISVTASTTGLINCNGKAACQSSAAIKCVASVECTLVCNPVVGMPADRACPDGSKTMCDGNCTGF